MDFWSRLIGGLGANQSKQSTSNDPQQRLGRFRKIYNQTLQAWHKSSSGGGQPDLAYTTVIQTHLQRLTDALRQDIRAPAPHLCVSSAASSKIYTAVSVIACSFNDELIAKEAVGLFSTLIDSEEEDFLSSQPFAEALTTLVDRVLGSGVLIVEDDTEAEILELLFSIAAKIRLEPELLPVWFTSSDKPDKEAPPAGPNRQAVKLTATDGFPLCYHFIGRVYREGKIGDFARTGLLYIFEAASESSELEEWLAEGDLPTLMASGLGALYSQLSRKLSISHPIDSLPLILALADVETNRPAADVEDFFSESLQTQLDTFMSYFIFWQDILEHCKSVSVKQTLIDHFQVFFLQQILYPSLLQSSDVDGGSSVAVLTYLWRILESVNHPDLTHMMLHYLLAIAEPLPPRSPVAEKRRKSLSAFSESLDVNPSFFNLVDLCLASLRSYNTQTVTAALRLVSIILSKHHNYAVETLLRTISIKSSPGSRTVGTLQYDVEIFLGLCRTIGGEEGMDEAYGLCLKDALGLLETHICSTDLLRVGEPSGEARKFQHDSVLTESSRTVQSHILSPDDQCLRLLLRILQTFFTNNIETNLGVTDALAHLASCPYLRLDGWLASGSKMSHEDHQDVDSESKHENNGDEDAENILDELETLEQERVLAYKRTRERPSMKLLPSLLLKVLQSLTTQLQQVKDQIPDFDSLVASRKRAFVGAAENERSLSPGMQPIISPRSSTEMSRDPSTSQSLLTERRQDLKSPDAQLARSPSPRGRAMQAIAGKRLNTPSLSPSKPPRSPLLSLSPSGSERPMRMLSPTGSNNRPLSPKKFTDGPFSRPPQPPDMAPVDTELFDQKLKFPVPSRELVSDSALQDEATDEETKEEFEEASLNHVLTNVVILQEFVLELAALMHVRASLFDGEVRFT